MVFYPGNQLRADRLQQLINNIGLIQTEIANEQKRMNELDTACQVKLNQLLKDGKIESLEELKKKAMSKLTDEDKDEYNQLISATRTVGQVTETMYWAGFVLGGGKLTELGGKAIMAIIRGIAGIQAVRVAVTAFIDTIGKLAQSGASAGKGWHFTYSFSMKLTGYLTALANVAKKASDIMEGKCSLIARRLCFLKDEQRRRRSLGLLMHSNYLQSVYEVESRMSQVFRWVGRIGKFLAWCGPALIAMAPLVEIFTGGQQKESLIEAIHETQVTRLVIDALKKQARNITEKMSSMSIFLSLLEKGKKATADAVGGEMIESIKEENEKIDLAVFEEDLRKSDQSTLRFYDKDDLDKNTVVQRAEQERIEDMKELNMPEKA
ncbi:hypothetical protein H0H92_006783 [Tricholoma furcatifolium]|nr:hypothetical protein H0H92_006783 [Tricholoma furcatifolium]